MTPMRSSVVLALALVGLSAGPGLTQAGLEPVNDLPNPYHAPDRNWAMLPDSRTCGSTAGVEIGPRNEIWAIERCAHHRIFEGRNIHQGMGLN